MLDIWLVSGDGVSFRRGIARRLLAHLTRRMYRCGNSSNVYLDTKAIFWRRFWPFLKCQLPSAADQSCLYLPVNTIQWYVFVCSYVSFWLMLCVYVCLSICMRVFSLFCITWLFSLHQRRKDKYKGFVHVWFLVNYLVQEKQHSQMQFSTNCIVGSSRYTK